MKSACIAGVSFCPPQGVEERSDFLPSSFSFERSRPTTLERRESDPPPKHPRSKSYSKLFVKLVVILVLFQTDKQFESTRGVGYCVHYRSKPLSLGFCFSALFILRAFSIFSILTRVSKRLSV